MASPTRGGSVAAFTCSLSADAPCLWQEQHETIQAAEVVDHAKVAFKSGSPVKAAAARQSTCVDAGMRNADLTL